MNIKRTMGIVATTGVLLSALMAGAGAANASPGETTSQQSFTSKSCLTEVRAIAAKTRVGAGTDESVCSGTVTITESAPQRASAAQVKAYASDEKLNAEATQSLTTAAAAGVINYRSWTHSYWSGSIVEKHAGTTYWGGGKAWIASYQRYTGNHTCHSQGSWAVGMGVKELECTHPGAYINAIASYRFEVGAVVAGSPFNFTVGLHYQTNSDGTTKSWQIGG